MKLKVNQYKQYTIPEVRGKDGEIIVKGITYIAGNIINTEDSNVGKHIKEWEKQTGEDWIDFMDCGENDTADEYIERREKKKVIKKKKEEETEEE